MSSRRNEPISTVVLRRGLTRTSGSPPEAGGSKQGVPGPGRGEKRRKPTKQKKTPAASLMGRQEGLNVELQEYNRLSIGMSKVLGKLLNKCVSSPFIFLTIKSTIS